MAKSTSKQAAKKKEESNLSGLTRKDTEAVVKRLKVLMNSDNEAVAVSACKELLDRGLGRPLQTIDQTTRSETDPESVAPDTKGLMARLRKGNQSRPSTPGSDTSIEETPGAQEPASPKKQGSNKPNGTGEPCKASGKPEKARSPSTDATDSRQP